jgi:hypothetical protein
MSKEIIALFNHATWELVPPADSPNLIGCKFVFRTKETLMEPSTDTKLI